MVYIQARLVALLGLCLFASTAGSLPSDKMSTVMRRQVPVPTPPTPIVALLPGNKDTKAADSNTKSTTPKTNESTGTETTAKQDKANTTNNDANPAAEKKDTTQSQSSQTSASQQPQNRPAATRRSTSGQSKHVLSKRGYPGRSGSRRNGHKSRPIHRHANRYRHGHIKTHHRKLVSPDPYQRYKHNGGYSA